MKYDKLLYGKSDIERIVGLEAVEDQVELFIQDEDGSIRSEFKPNRFWVLSNEPQGFKYVKLKGDLHYKYGVQFTTRKDFYSSRAWLKKQGKDFYSIFNPNEACMVKDGYTFFKGMKREEVSVLAFDIEATTLEHNEDAKVLIIANTFRDPKGKITRKLFSYDEYENEGLMIVAWCEWVRKMNPSIVVGHNIYSYDFPYLQFIANKYNQSLELGRDGSNLQIANYFSDKRYDGSRSIEYKRCKIYGRELIDTMFLAFTYDTATRKYESYGLKSIIKAEGLEVENRQFYDASLIRKNYTIPEEWKKIKQYAEHDGDDALALYDLMSPSFFYLSQMIPKSFQQIIESATGSQINSLLVRSYLQDGYSIPKASGIKKFEGALSYGIPGIYKNCFKLDISSLYPNICLEYKVYNKDKDPNANFYISLKTLTEKRLEYKRLGKTDKYYDDLQNSFKILVNSYYGMCNAEGLNFNYPEGGEFITKTGREILQKAIVWATGEKLEIKEEVEDEQL